MKQETENLIKEARTRRVTDKQLEEENPTVWEGVITEAPEINGTWYDEHPHPEVYKHLENARSSGTRLKITYGDVKTGKSWEPPSEVKDPRKKPSWVRSYGALGRIGRSTGSQKVPLEITSSRSMGGGALLTGSIVKIEHANKKHGGVIWQHPKYHIGEQLEESRYQLPKPNNRRELEHHGGEDCNGCRFHSTKASDRKRLQQGLRDRGEYNGKHATLKYFGKSQSVKEDVDQLIQEARERKKQLEEMAKFKMAHSTYDPNTGKKEYWTSDINAVSRNHAFKKADIMVMKKYPHAHEWEHNITSDEPRTAKEKEKHKNKGYIK
jgi:hypothetical protein